MTLDSNVSALPSEQQALWPLLRQVPPGFILYGGTALALRLGHRVSVDFDFFSSRPFDPGVLQSVIPFLVGGRISQSDENTLTIWVRASADGDEVKMSFFGGISFPVIECPDIARSNGIAVASLRDLAGTKAAVIRQRIELKDYLDIEALLDSGMTLSEIVAAAVSIFPGQIDFVGTVRALTYFEDGAAKTFPLSLRKRLVVAAKGAFPVRAPKPSYLSIEAAAAAAGR
jgi:hypothetical protein